MKRQLDIVLFSGGRGTQSISEVLLKHPQVSLSVIINAYDDGLSTGAIRRFVPGMLGPSDVRKNLNRMMRCPYGQKKVYIRSVLDGSSGGTSKPVLALRCAVMEYVGQAMGGYNIVMKDHIEKVCCADYLHCQVYQEFLRRKAKR